MSITQVSLPTSHVRLGVARVEMTPPVGIHHGIWGAAPPHAATAIHRPHYADVLVFGSTESTAPQLLIAYLDLVGLEQSIHDDMRRALSEASGIPFDNTIVTYSHSHATANLSMNRLELPGGEEIPDFLAELQKRLAQGGQEAASNMQAVVITYATGRCNMANNRDYWDDANNLYACGFNPETQGDDTVLVARATDLAGVVVTTVVNYGCHPTTLAWDNWLNSPDYPGAMREVVESVTNAPCIFALSACGDLGPRHGFVGDTAVADKNGRWLGYAALATLESMDPPATNFAYQGPVLSGATIGTWHHAPMDAEQMAQATYFAGGEHTIDLPLKPLPDRAQLEADVEQGLARIVEAKAAGDDLAARDYGARVERARRWIGRVDNLPADSSTFPYHFAVYRMGDAVWVFGGGEPYSVLQMALRQRFPDLAIVISPLAGDLAVAYLLPQDRYGKGLYQEEPSILALGCLEALIAAIAEQIEKLK